MITAQMQKDYKKYLGPRTKETDDGLEKLITEINADPGFKDDPAGVAYLLATVWHETYVPQTGQRFVPLIEQHDGTGDAFYEGLYGFATAEGKRLGNKKAGDASWYKGRGYVKVRGLKEYERMSKLLGTPGLHETSPFAFVALPFAYKVLAGGLRDGLFTGRKLGDFRRKNGYNYVGARAVVTDEMDFAEEIAEHARAIFNILAKREKEAA